MAENQRQDGREQVEERSDRNRGPKLQRQVKRNGRRLIYAT